MFRPQFAVSDHLPQKLDRMPLEVPSQADARPRRVVGDKYVVGARLGVGGMGTVYSATEIGTGDQLAIKVLDGITPTSLWQFKREFRELADVVHPNVVRLRELLLDEGRLYLAMERICGRELGVHLKRVQRGDYHELRRVLGQLTEGVAAIHEAGKLHLDLKPSNVFVADDGRVVVLDFGLAADRRTVSDWTPAGTPEYMAPEQAVGRSIGPWTDCYAMGVVLYEALTAVLPFEEDSYGALVKAKRKGNPRPPSAIVSGVPADLERLCLRLLDPDIERRAGVDEVRACLGTGASARPPMSRQPPVELVGRAPELRQLRDAFEAARRGRATATLVEGQAGMGKTALVRRFLDDVRSLERVVVLEARCHPRETLPFRMLDALVDALVGALLTEPADEIEALLPPGIEALARLFPVLDRVSAIGRRRTEGGSADLGGPAMTALCELVQRLAARRTVVMFMDDLQWGDVESAWVLRELLQAMEGSVIFLGCHRSEDATNCPALTELGRPQADGEIGTVSVPPLAMEDARALVAQRLFRVDEARVAAIVAEAGGHPALLTALATTGGAAIETSLASMFAARIRGVSEAARALLDIVVRSSTPVELARARAALTGEGASIAFVELCSAQLARQLGCGDAARLEPYHPSVRLAALGDSQLPSADSDTPRRDDGRAAQPPARRVGARRPSAGRRRERGEAALRAATEAERTLAFERAAALYGLALRSLATTPKGARDLQTRCAGALAAAGETASAAGQYLRAAGRVREPGARTSRRLAADQLLRSGRWEEGVAVLRSVMLDADVRFAESESSVRRRWMYNRARLRMGGLRLRGTTRCGDPVSACRLDAYWTAATGLGDTDPLRGCELGSSHLIAALRGGDPAQVARGAAYYASRLACFLPASQMVDDLLHLAGRTATEVGSPALRGLVATMSGVVAYERGHWAHACELLEAATQHFPSQGEGRWERMLIDRHRALALAHRGELADCIGVLDSVSKSDAGAAVLANDVVLRAALGHLSHLMAGAPRPAGAGIYAAVAQLPRGAAPDAHAWARLARIQIALFERKFDVASRLIETARVQSWGGPGEDRHSSRIWLAFADATCSVATCQFRRAARAAQILRGSSPVADALAGLVDVQIRVAEDDVEDVSRVLNVAATALDAAGLRLHAMATRYRAAQLVGGAGGDAERAQLRGALVRDGVNEPVQFLSVFVPAVFEGLGRRKS